MENDGVSKINKDAQKNISNSIVDWKQKKMIRNSISFRPNVRPLVRLANARAQVSASFMKSNSSVTKRSRNPIKSVAFDLVLPQSIGVPKKNDSTEKRIYLFFLFWLATRNANYFVQTEPEGVYSFLIFLVFFFILRWSFEMTFRRRTSHIVIFIVVQTKHRHTFHFTLKWFKFFHLIFFLFIFIKIPISDHYHFIDNNNLHTSRLCVYTMLTFR